MSAVRAATLARASRLPRRRATLLRRTAAGRRLRVTRERLVRRGRALPLRLPLRGAPLLRQLHARLPRLRQTDRDRLLRRPRAVLAFTNVMDLLAHELARLRAGRLALTLR